MELISHVADFYEFLGAIFTKTNAKSAISSPHFQFLLERLIYALKEDICQSKQFTYESNNTKSNTEDQNWAFKKFYTFIRTISNKYGQSNVNDFASKFMQNLGEILLEKYKNPEKQKLFSLEFLQQTKEEDYKDLLDLKSHAKEFNIAKIPQQGTQIQTGQSFQSNKPKNQSVVHDPLSYKSPYCQHSVHLMFSSFWDKDFFTRIFINPNANEISKEETELISHVADFYEFLGAIFTNANKTSRVSLYRMQELLDLLRYALNEDICQPKKFTYSLAHPARHLSFFVCLIERTYQFLFRCLATGSSLYQSNNTKSIDYNSRFKEFYTFIKTISNKYSGNDRPNDFANTFMQTLAKILLEKYMSPIEKTLFSWKTFSESKPENFKKLLDLKSHAKKFNIPKSKSTDKTKKNNDNDSFPFAAIGLILFFIYLLIHENF